jgi:hypothetical protein
MKKTFVILVAFFSLISCEVGEETNIQQDNSFANDPASGKVYGTNFTFAGGYANNIVMNDIQKLDIYLSNQNLNCSNSDLTFPIYISSPKAIGIHTTNVSVKFRNVSNTEFVTTATGVRVQITSISGSLVKGKIRAAVSANNTINGTFEVPLCE